MGLPLDATESEESREERKILEVGDREGQRLRDGSVPGMLSGHGVHMACSQDMGYAWLLDASTGLGSKRFIWGGCLGLGLQVRTQHPL